MKAYDHNDPDSSPTPVECLIGQTIANAQIGKDKGGYDLLTLTLGNGEVFQVYEQGQCGYFTLHHITEPTNTKAPLDTANSVAILQAAVERLATIIDGMQKTQRMAANDANVAEAKADRALRIVTELQERIDKHTQWSAEQWANVDKLYRIERAAQDGLAVRIGKLERGEVATVATRQPFKVEIEPDIQSWVDWAAGNLRRWSHDYKFDGPEARALCDAADRLVKVGSPRASVSSRQPHGPPYTAVVQYKGGCIAAKSNFATVDSALVWFSGFKRRKQEAHGNGGFYSCNVVSEAQE